MNTYSRHSADPSWVAACLICYLYSGGSHAGAHSCPESEKGFCGAIANWSSISCPPGRKFLQGLAVGGWLCMHVNCCLWRWVVHSCPPGVCPTGVAWRGLKRVLSDVVNSFMGIWICNLYWAQSLFGLGVHSHESCHLSAVHAAATAVIAAMCTDSLGGSKLLTDAATAMLLLCALASLAELTPISHSGPPDSFCTKSESWRSGDKLSGLRW